MPAENGIKMADKAVAASKKVLDRANKFEKSAGGPLKKEAPVSAPAPAKEKMPHSGLLGDQGASEAAGIKANADNIRSYNESGPSSAAAAVGAMQSMHEGGEVEEDGPKNLQKGESVLPKDKNKAEAIAMKHLGKKAGAMSAAVEEEKDEKETPKEEKAEGKKGEKAEEKRKTSDKHSPAKEEKSEGEVKHHKHAVSVVHHHKTGHTLHHMAEDGSHQMHQFALGDHAGIASKMAELTGGEEGQDQGGQPQGGAPEGGSPQGGAPQA